MPPRYAYWTIIFGNQPTSFARHARRAAADVPQIQSKHPDAVMMWFAHGRLWKSPEEAREARYARRHRACRRPPASPEVTERWRREASMEGSPRDPRAPAPRRQEPVGATGPIGPIDPIGRQPPIGRRRPAIANRHPPTANGLAAATGGPAATTRTARNRFKVPRDVKRARFKAQAWRDRTSQAEAARPRRRTAEAQEEDEE
jgi:hypothetical protein